MYPEGDASKTMSLEPDEVRTFKIKARVKDNVVGSLDEGGISTIKLQMMHTSIAILVKLRKLLTFHTMK